MDVYFHHFPLLDSTNTWLLKHLDSLDPDGITVVTVAEQTAGKGRRGHAWVSKLGNLHLSLFFTLQKDDPSLANLPQLLSYATAQVLLKEKIAVQIKWPNDLLIEGKKLAGAMALKTPANGRQGVIVGLGMNVNAPVTTDQPTISLYEVDGKQRDVLHLRDAIVSHFLQAMKMSFASLAPFFNQLLAFKGEEVTFSIGEKTMRGIVRGIDDRGWLEMEIDGVLHAFCSGEIFQLRKL